eukprot:scaffold11626_cov147-Skeletonema_marinoi.AAC.2
MSGEMSLPGEEGAGRDQASEKTLKGNRGLSSSEQLLGVPTACLYLLHAVTEKVNPSSLAI